MTRLLVLVAAAAIAVALLGGLASNAIGLPSPVAFLDRGDENEPDENENGNEDEGGGESSSKNADAEEQADDRGSGDED